jgi:protease-4
MRNFFLGLLAGLLLAALGAAIAFIVIIRAGAAPPSIPASSILVVRIRGSVPEKPGLEIPLPFFEQTSVPTVRDTWELLKKAAADSRIRALVLEPSDLTAGWAKMQEIRNDILEFRKSGKPVYAFLSQPGLHEYYVATAAGRIFMAPEDYLNVTGLRVELMYLKNTLDKLGIKAEIEHAGKYKDFGDMFTRTSMSPATAEVMNSILDDMYSQLLQTVAAARKKTPDQVRTIIDNGPFLAQQAKDAGLIDGLRYEDQVFGDLDRQLKLGGIRKVSEDDYLRVSPQSVGIETGSRIAFIAAEGDILQTGSPADGITPDGMRRIFGRVGSDNSIKGVILRIDSPGGDSVASDAIWREAVLLSRKKPLVISMSDDAASGGYYIAMTGDHLFAYPGTYTGSIGVFFGKADLRGLYNKLGITKDILTRGRFADMTSDYTPLSGAERAKLQYGIDQNYRAFVKVVADARKRPFDQIEPLAQGRVWLGSQAKANGLVDALGGIDSAVEYLKQKAGLGASDKVRLVSYPPKRSIFDLIFKRSNDALGDVPALKFLRRYATGAWTRGCFFRLMPYTIEIK